MANSKCLIAYFSRKGNNYLGGSIVNLPIGNTEVVAHKIQAITGSDLFQIQTAKSYPDDYTETTIAAQDELSADARPELAKMVDSMDSYDIFTSGIRTGGEPCRWRYLRSWTFTISQE